MKPTDHFRIARQLAGDTAGAIDLGCKDVPQAPIGLDADFRVRPAVVGSVLDLPVRSAAFEKAFLLETLEHLPGGSEAAALNEIGRILKPNGCLILSTPNDTWVHKYLDLAYWLKGHRHYKKGALCGLVERSGFSIEEISVRGNYWHPVKALFYYLITKLLGIPVPAWLLDKADKGYDFISDRGAAIIIKARRAT